jgi:hypothetical protein
LKEKQLPIYCKQCKKDLSDFLDEGINREPCPKCGSTSRVFVEQLSISAKAYVGLRAKHNRGPGKAIWESVNCPDVFRKTGELMRLERIIDRENNVYREVVTNVETGEVVYNCEEPLSDHLGHGSAKHSLSNNE